MITTHNHVGLPGRSAATRYLVYPSHSAVTLFPDPMSDAVLAIADKAAYVGSLLR